MWIFINYSISKSTAWLYELLSVLPCITASCEGKLGGFFFKNVDNFPIYLFCNFDDTGFIVVDDDLLFLKVVHVDISKSFWKYEEDKK